MHLAFDINREMSDDISKHMIMIQVVNLIYLKGVFKYHMAFLDLFSR